MRVCHAVQIATWHCISLECIRSSRAWCYLVITSYYLIYMLSFNTSSRAFHSLAVWTASMATSPCAAYTCNDYNKKIMCIPSSVGNIYKYYTLYHCVLRDSVQRVTVSHQIQLRFSHEILKWTSCIVKCIQWHG